MLNNDTVVEDMGVDKYNVKGKKKEEDLFVPENDKTQD
jgi:hypothetical protein